MRPGLLQFRRFSTRLLALLLGLLLAVLVTIYALVSRANQAAALDHARRNLELAAGIFDDTVQQRIDALATSAGLLTSDYTIKQFFTRAERPDTDTLNSILPSLADRVHSSVVILLANDQARTLIGNSDPGMEPENLGPFQYLSREATIDQPVAHGFSYFKGQLSVLVVIPLYAPRPQIAAWVGLTFPIDREFVDNLKRTTGIDVTFVAIEDAADPRVLTSTLPPATTPLVVAAARASGRATGSAIVDLPEDRYVTHFRRQAMLGENPINLVLQRPLSPELTAARALQRYLLWVSLAAFGAAALLALWISRGISQPVRQLAAHTKLVAAGDCATRLELDRADELGQLATAFNAMSTGLAERDRVRDLLDKNVSPEIAAQLMRDGGAALGGEEREVTILFADLRGFTTLSEKLPPRELLALLNRYLDHMSTAIEAHGGVIDKFIGDAIMALFGAPVAQGDAAPRALAAALAMERALVNLNAELAAEDRPPLAIGIGVNTARVVAGNIGSARRLNYSVIGDGVNVAARLQSETRKPDHRTNIITSAATVAVCRRSLSPDSRLLTPDSSSPTPAFRPLGPVKVKGRAEPVEIFAVE